MFRTAHEYIEWTEEIRSEYSNQIIVYTEKETDGRIKRDIITAGNTNEEVIDNLQIMHVKKQIDPETPLCFLSFKEDLIGL
jgi:hypothetical protein